MGYYTMANMSEETEWWSNCCTAPPLFDLHDTGEYYKSGICMSCREHATFDTIEEEVNNASD